MSGSQQGTCGAHAGLGSDLRGTALVLLERLRAAVEPLREGTAPEPGSPGACHACPVCAVVAVLRGERSELATQLAEHATGLVAVLAAVLEAEEPAPGPRPDPAARNGGGSGHTGGHANGYAARVPSAHGRSVQRITVHRR